MKNRKKPVGKPTGLPGMLLRCFGASGECASDSVLVVPGGHSGDLTPFMFQNEWYMSVVNLPVAGPKQFALAPLCKTCAAAAHPPEVFKAACESLSKSMREHRAPTPALPPGALEERRKAGKDVVTEIESVLARPGMWCETPDELRGMLRGMLYALVVTRPSHGTREAPVELPSGAATLEEAAKAGRESLKDVTRWLDDVEAECWKRISS